MRSLFTLGITGIVLASASIALAHTTSWAWTEKKAERMVARDATVRVKGSEKANLEAELRASAQLYGALAFAARDVGDTAAMQTFDTLAHSFREALEDVRSGLEIDATGCRGLGTAAKGRRFSHFRCVATSEVLEIPSPELVYPEGAELPTVTEGPSRRVGPWQATLGVHVIGSSTMRYAQAE